MTYVNTLLMFIIYLIMLFFYIFILFKKRVYCGNLYINVFYIIL